MKDRPLFSWRQMLPREHGAWFMWGIPLGLGTVLSRPTLLHALLAAGALLLHLASHNLLEAARGAGTRPWRRRAGFALGAGGITAVLPALLARPALALLGAMAAVLFLYTLQSARRHTERTLRNDAAGIAALQFWGPAAYTVGAGGVDRTAGLLWIFCFLFFLGSALHVKTLFRERGDRRFKRWSNAVHLGLLLVPPLLGVPRAAWAYGPGLLRSLVLPAGARLPPLRAGLLEMTTALAFALLLAWTLR